VLTVRRAGDHELLGKTWLVAGVDGQPWAVAGGASAHCGGPGVGHLQ
jgi:hypothetical protein